MRRGVAELVSRGEELAEKNKELKGVVFDCQYTVDELERMPVASSTLSKVNLLLIKAIDTKRQLEEARILSRASLGQYGATGIN